MDLVKKESSSPDLVPLLAECALEILFEKIIRASGVLDKDDYTAHDIISSLEKVLLGWYREYKKDQKQISHWVIFEKFLSIVGEKFRWKFIFPLVAFGHIITGESGGSGGHVLTSTTSLYNVLYNKKTKVIVGKQRLYKGAIKTFYPQYLNNKEIRDLICRWIHGKEVGVFGPYSVRYDSDLDLHGILVKNDLVVETAFPLFCMLDVTASSDVKEDIKLYFTTISDIVGTTMKNRLDLLLLRSDLFNFVKKGRIFENEHEGTVFIDITESVKNVSKIDAPEALLFLVKINKSEFDAIEKGGTLDKGEDLQKNWRVSFAT